MHVDGWTCSETNQVAKDDQNISEVSWQWQFCIFIAVCTGQACSWDFCYGSTLIVHLGLNELLHTLALLSILEPEWSITLGSLG
jgi:hypothetical protein